MNEFGDSSDALRDGNVAQRAGYGRDGGNRGGRRDGVGGIMTRHLSREETKMRDTGGR